MSEYNLAHQSSQCPVSIPIYNYDFHWPLTGRGGKERNLQFGGLNITRAVIDRRKNLQGGEQKQKGIFRS